MTSKDEPKKSTAAKSKPKKRTKSSSPQPEHKEGYQTTFGRAGTVLTGDWAKLAAAAGGVNALAQLVGVSYDTIYRWAARGGFVPVMGRPTIATLARGYGLPTPPMRTERGSGP